MLQHHPFTNLTRAKQLINFAGLEYGYNNRPTDIDALFELKNRLYVIVEAKFAGNQMPFGQELALTRLADDLSKIKPTLLILAKHSTPAEEMVDLASCAVTKVRYQGRWREPKQPTTVREMVDVFIGQVERSVAAKKQ